MLVYKNEDINNNELATLEEVKQAFFGAGILVKDDEGFYTKVTGFNPDTGEIMVGNNVYDTQDLGTGV